jgi:enterochelin esterase-like enzyme
MMNALRTAALFVLASVTASAIGEPKMVSPETLPQGFVVIVKDESKMASASRPIYFASGANSWDPGDPEYRLEPRSDTRWQYVFEPGELGENVEFKFTLGSWKFVETDEEGQDISNRTFPDVDVTQLKPGEKPVIELTVPRFREGTGEYIIAPEYRPLENVTGTVKRLQVAGGAGSADGTMRDLLVWLPPGYDDPANAGKSYPVLYMHDGQNLYSDHEGIPDEWGLDETAQRLVASGVVRPFIAVGIPHADEARIEEYVPSMGRGVTVFGKTPHGDQHVHWIIREVMPRVERAFRVRTGAWNTGVGGASAGGLIALHAGLMHPDVFGLVLAESPALMLDEVDLDMVRAVESAEAVPERVYIGMGEAENLPASGFYDRASGRHVEAARRLRDALKGRAEVKLVVDEDGLHNEEAWGERLPEALRFLFPAD